MMTVRTAAIGAYSSLAFTAISERSFRTGSPAFARKERPSRTKGSVVVDATARRLSADTALSTDSRKEGRFGIFIGNGVIASRRKGRSIAGYDMVRTRSITYLSLT